MELTENLCHVLTIEYDDEIYTLAYFHEDCVTCCKEIKKDCKEIKKDCDQKSCDKKDCDN